MRFYSNFKPFYQNQKESRLKAFKAEFPINSYFEIKLAIIRIARGIEMLQEALENCGLASIHSNQDKKQSSKVYCIIKIL